MKESIEFYLEIITPYGTFEGEVYEGSVEHYNGMLEVVKQFYTQEIFDTYLNDGSFMVINKDMIRQSVIIVRVIKD